VAPIHHTADDNEPVRRVDCDARHGTTAFWIKTVWALLGLLITIGLATFTTSLLVGANAVGTAREAAAVATDAKERISELHGTLGQIDGRLARMENNQDKVLERLGVVQGRTANHVMQYDDSLPRIPAAPK
jgi:hypothetical protein